MKVLIIGGGASGMMAALSAAEDGSNRVMLLERQGLAPAIPVGCAAAMTLLILWAHRENMARLARGEENKV